MKSYNTPEMKALEFEIEATIADDASIHTTNDVKFDQW